VLVENGWAGHGLLARQHKKPLHPVLGRGLESEDHAKEDADHARYAPKSTGFPIPTQGRVEGRPAVGISDVRTSPYSLPSYLQAGDDGGVSSTGGGEDHRWLRDPAKRTKAAVTSPAVAEERLRFLPRRKHISTDKVSRRKY
jgi:hypothetical protein